ncbi:hypothetical protein B0I37DRAFT_196155 [Chaetomium sp. MPI-CAGE-AT-0009]|nr:hypothetical protein B0I37DRAFT_196155 [Chaetomium sp. MPI-CAGE-AT-0009]
MTPQPFHLGALPPELFDKVFLELDTVRDLANFIRTAHFVYHRFRAQRRTIIFRVIQNELGAALYDAGFLSVFPYSDPGDEEHYHDGIYFMVDVYRHIVPLNVLLRRHDKRVRDDFGTPTMEELTGLCRTLHHIKYITDLYITAQLAAFNLAGGGGTPATAPPSRLERQRIMRAFYRRQIMSNAWAPTRRPGDHRWGDADSNAFHNMYEDEGHRLGLFALFYPWEMQHIDHANCFIMRLCCMLVHRAAEQAEGGGGGHPILLAQFGNLHSHLGHLVEYLRAHRSVADAAIDDMVDDLHRKTLIQADDPRLQREFIFRYELVPLTCYWQIDRAQSFPDPDLDKAEQIDLKMDYFVGDGLDQIPFGWSDALGGRYVRWYGTALPQIPWLPLWSTGGGCVDHVLFIELWRLAGFALWDRKRVEALKRLSRFEGLQTGFVLDRS